MASFVGPTLRSAPAATSGPLAAVGGETLDISADELDVNIALGTAVLNGNVRAKMGDLKVECPKVEIRYDQAPQVRWARCSGGVRATLKGIDATASVVVLDVASRNVKLQGGVRLTRGRGWVEAEHASIDINTRHVTLRDVKGSIPVEPPSR
ncbi:MAG TPA: LptA/OstA family protein [Polyangiaceae bacterium]